MNPNFYLLIILCVNYDIIIIFFIMQQSFIELDNKLRADYQLLKRKILYGTAGFRDLAQNIQFISFRAGVFVSILNQTNPSKCLGIVVSASHNKIQDNGLKITNFQGNMLEMEYEPIIQNFVHTDDLLVAIQNFKTYLTSKNRTIYSGKVKVCVGGDTRPSTNRLIDLIIRGIQSQNGQAVNFGTTTTPQLQYYVYYINSFLDVKEINIQKIRPTFWNDFSTYYTTCAQYLKSNTIKKRTIDCANGVGGVTFPSFINLLAKYFQFELINNKENDKLNDKCGADFVKTTKKFPLNFQSRQHNSFISFDGDADRIVLYTQAHQKLQLIDGDRIGTLLTIFFRKLLDQLNVLTNQINNHESNCMYVGFSQNTSLGFVQTYYANSASAHYLKKNFNMNPTYAATGVKHLHEKAQHYDIGIYFEGNGHGTVIFKKTLLQKIDAFLLNKQSLLNVQIVKNNEQFSKKLNHFFDFLDFFRCACRLANPSVGDAITDLLLIQTALDYLKFSYSDLLNIYTDYQSRTSKIKVKNKNALKVTDIEDKVVYPLGLQDSIQEILKKHGGIKGFLRASGTQDVLRLHVQANNIELIERIQTQINQLVGTNKELN